MINNSEFFEFTGVENIEEVNRIIQFGNNNLIKKFLIWVQNNPGIFSVSKYHHKHELWVRVIHNKVTFKVSNDLISIDDYSGQYTEDVFKNDNRLSKFNSDFFEYYF